MDALESAGPGRAAGGGCKSLGPNALVTLLKDVIACVPELWGDYVTGGKIKVELDADTVDRIEAALARVEREGS